mgnify:CR=1 FL=1
MALPPEEAQRQISRVGAQPEEEMCARIDKGFERVVSAVEAAVAAGYHHAGSSTIKVNVCVMNGFNEDEIADFVGWTKDMPVDVRFIEWMPFGGNEWNDEKFFSTYPSGVKDIGDISLMSVDLREDKRIEAGVTAEILFGFWVYASSVDPAKIVACPPGV